MHEYSPRLLKCEVQVTQGLATIFPDAHVEGWFVPGMSSTSSASSPERSPNAMEQSRIANENRSTVRLCPRSRACEIAALWVCCVLAQSTALAGGGPENVLLVVNSRDPDSLTIANHFIELRDIPVWSVLYLDWPPEKLTTGIDTFRRRILAPILSAIKNRQLEDQIDYVVYSSGFPYAINFRPELGNVVDRHPWASLTSLTYFHQLVMTRSLAFRSRGANRYANPNPAAQTRGYRARYVLDALGKRSGQTRSGPGYLLSMMLGYTKGERNNTTDQIVNYLTRGKQADFTNPKGTIYYVKNGNVRSTTRDNGYEAAVATLRAAGVQAEVIRGTKDSDMALPKGRSDVQGLMTGYFEHFWGISGSTIQPGAICENFTSYGGVLSGIRKQSLLCNFLRYGAVASSGTVVEPFAIADKFPHPWIQVHYVKGSSVAEAFYQSVRTPYQLIMVGDPLCQPWATPPKFTVSGLPTADPVSGIVRIRATPEPGSTVRYYEVFVDGRRVAQAEDGSDIQFDSTSLASGHHELRIVAISDTPLETQARHIASFVSHNVRTKKVRQDVTGTNSPESSGLQEDRDLPKIVSALTTKGDLAVGKPAAIRVQSAGARELRIYRGRDKIGAAAGDSGTIPINAKRLGTGPVTLQIVALSSEPGRRPVFSAPIKVRVQPSAQATGPAR